MTDTWYIVDEKRCGCGSTKFQIKVGAVVSFNFQDNIYEIPATCTGCMEEVNLKVAKIVEEEE